MEPARVMSGWVASRLVAESASRSLYVDRAPGLFAASGGATVPAKPPTLSLSNGGGYAVVGGSSNGAGTPLGMGAVRLELSLKERMAALASRREERDKRNMALRRFYVAQLRNYHLEGKVRVCLHVLCCGVFGVVGACVRRVKPARMQVAHANCLSHRVNSHCSCVWCVTSLACMLACHFAP